MFNLTKSNLDLTAKILNETMTFCDLNAEKAIELLKDENYLSDKNYTQDSIDLAIAELQMNIAHKNKIKANLQLCGDSYILLTHNRPELSKRFYLSGKALIKEYCDTNNIEILNKSSWNFPL